VRVCCKRMPNKVSLRDQVAEHLYKTETALLVGLLFTGRGSYATGKAYEILRKRRGGLMLETRLHRRCIQLRHGAGRTFSCAMGPAQLRHGAGRHGAGRGGLMLETRLHRRCIQLRHGAGRTGSGRLVNQGSRGLKGHEFQLVETRTVVLHTEREVAAAARTEGGGRRSQVKAREMLVPYTNTVIVSSTSRHLELQAGSPPPSRRGPGAPGCRFMPRISHGTWSSRRGAEPCDLPPLPLPNQGWLFNRSNVQLRAASAFARTLPIGKGSETPGKRVWVPRQANEPQHCARKQRGQAGRVQRRKAERFAEQDTRQRAWYPALTSTQVSVCGAEKKRAAALRASITAFAAVAATKAAGFEGSRPRGVRRGRMRIHPPCITTNFNSS